ncbi:MAG TPA: Ppx/GppA phosphatase family protein [Acidobacteriaceae bacterium]|jgi:exopolyphosphatase/guanosine-5'-triphosphate,3'-diphosphate pyrophosphatase|nr:Ppx/GppA phosphatase family protein [Acidobacteriaceae bacterium]
MTTYAAVDIGSNSCRLKIAGVQNHRLRVLHEDREVTRLGESVFESGMVSPEAMANTIRALRRFHKAVQMHAVDRLRVVATSAMREARNQQAFVSWVQSATGWKVETISGLEEGRLIHLGVVSNEPGARGRCLLIDLGGGSCEITLSEHGRIREMVSLPLGAVRLTREFLRHDLPKPDEIARMRQFLQRELRRAERKLVGQRVQTVYATSGTAAALSEATLASRKGKRAASDRTNTEQVRKLTEKLTRMTNAQRAMVAGVGPRRSEIIVAGANVYAAMLDRLHLPGFRYSPMGLRDGILALMHAETEQRTTAHHRFEEERWASVLELCRHYGVDTKRVDPIRTHAEQLFDDLQNVHELPVGYQVWLGAAAMMHEAGKFMNYQGHHRHTQYIIANSELYGFTPEQRAITSAIARYLGKSRPSLNDRVMRSIPVQEHRNVQRAVVLLRLAVALHQDRVSDVLRVRTRVYPKRVLLEITPGRTGAELELWSLRKEAAYFREVFGRDLLTELV